MSADEKKDRVLENQDICALRGDGGHPNRYFVRCTLPVRLLDAPTTMRWGLWAEVAEKDSVIIWNAWDDPEQDKIPAMQASVANRIPGYPDTTGLPVLLRLTGPKSRPELSLRRDSPHPFVRECQAGVSIHRVREWLDALASSSMDA
jgi:hypothetical protein